jgi:hypothetical protein
VVYIPASRLELRVFLSVRRATNIEGSKAHVTDGETAILDEEGKGASEGRIWGREAKKAEAEKGKLLLAAPDEPGAVVEEDDGLGTGVETEDAGFAVEVGLPVPAEAGGGFSVLMGIFPDPVGPLSGF